MILTRCIRRTPWYGWLLIVASLAVGVGVLVVARSNRAHTHDNCLRTYEGIREVFQPFFREERLRTPEEERNIKIFNRRIEELKARCG